MHIIVHTIAVHNLCRPYVILAHKLAVDLLALDYACCHQLRRKVALHAPLHIHIGAAERVIHKRIAAHACFGINQIISVHAHRLCLLA